MDEIIIPSAPHWFKPNIAACTPDNIFLYGAKNDLTIIKEDGRVEILTGPVSYITSLGINKRWGEPHKYCVVLHEVGILKVWDINTLTEKYSIDLHVENRDLIAAVFAGEDRIVTVSTFGVITIWNFTTDELNVIKHLFPSKSVITCLASCPHASWLVGFGLQNGLVIVCDLRRNGKVLFKLRGHEKGVQSLVWCPAPINIFPKNPNNTVKMYSSQSNAEKIDDTVKENPWRDLLNSNDCAENKANSAQQPVDFLQECQELKDKILQIDKEKSDLVDSVIEDDNIVEKDCVEQNIDVEAIQQILDDNDDEEKSDRPLPNLYDPSNDFFDEINDNDDLIKKIEDFKDYNKSESSEQIKEIIDEIVSVPVLAKNIVETEEEPRHEYLLASTGVDRNIYIWRAGTDGRMQTFFSVGKKKTKSKTKSPWIVACWPLANIMITTSNEDEILMWDLTQLKKCVVVHKQHQSVVFNIVAPVKYLEKENWAERSNDLQIWTHNGFDIINYNISRNETKLFYSTITSCVSAMKLSPLDPNRLAIGMRDGYIRIWDLSSSTLKSIKLQTIKKLQSKITTLCFHPIKENLLAYGCEDGQLGYVDILTQKSTKFRYSLHNQIYHIEYGPYPDTDQLQLYVIGENRVFIYIPDKSNESPTILELSEKLIAHSFTWKPDFNLLLVSMRDGSVHVFNKQLELLTKLYFNEKGLNAIVWHPNQQLYTNWFAAATSKGFFIYDCSQLLKSDAVLDQCNLIESKIVDLEGHLRPVTDLCWNPFNDDQILSTSNDGLTHIWDIREKIVIATFIDDYKPLATAVTWSPIDKDLIIFGTRIVVVWNLTKHPPNCGEEFLANRKKLLKNDTTTTKPKVETIKPKKIPKNCIVPTLYTSSDDNLEHQINNMRKLMERSLNQNSNNDIFELFGSRDDVLNLLSKNFELHNKESKPQYCDLISLWKGDISDRIKSAIDENRVTPSIIMLAPMVSPKLWQDACESYARKLAESRDADPLEIVKFYLACHKIEEAIDILCQSNLYREAVALAKCRFAENSEIVHKILDKWATHAVVNGNFEAAAYCYLSLGNFEEAAKILARRNNLEFLEFAKELAQKCDNKDLCDSIKFKCDEIVKDHEEKSLPTRVEVELRKLTINVRDSDHSSIEFYDAQEVEDV